MKRKKGKRRKAKPRILIMCEGETERDYFLAMKEDKDYKHQLAAINPHVVKAKHPTPENLVKEATKREKEEANRQNPYDRVWVVFDHDFHPKRKIAFDKAKKEGFSIAFSAIAFELWYLLHFKKIARDFPNESQLQKQLEKHYKGYQKAKQNDFENLKDKLFTAIGNAQWLRKQVKDNAPSHITDRNPWVDVDKLVLELINLGKGS